MIDDYLKAMDVLYGNSVNPMKLLLTHGHHYCFDHRSFRGKRGKVHGCYENAAKIALDDPEFTYVEGYVGVLIPIEHAWVIGLDGCVRDPTLRNTKDNRVTEYFGIPFKTDYLRRTIVRTKVWGLIGHHNRGLFAADPEEFLG